MKETQDGRGQITRRHETVEDFLFDISVFGSYFSKRGRSSGTWIFRGHENAKWKCHPCACRPSTQEKLKQTALGGKFGTHTYAQQEFVEAYALQQFLTAADATGVVIPDDSVGTRVSLDKRIRVLNKLIRSKEEPFRKVERSETLYGPSFLSQLALAQHYGVPTRLLDWSRNPYIAAFFAALNTSDDKGDELCVVAIDRTAINDIQHYNSVEDNGLIFVEVPSWANVNLFAQKGLFTLIEINQDPDNEFTNSTVESAIESLIELTERNGTLFSGKVLVKFCLDGIHRQRLLEYLLSMGISHTTVQPNLYSAVKDAFGDR